MSDPVVSSADSELRAHVERVLSAHYELDREIGRGGFGIVYRAKDRRLKRVVAIKILPPELAFRSELKTRFLREAETAAQLNHPNIVDIYSVDEAEGLVYFVMAYVNGENLAKRLHDRGVLPCDEVRRILREVADALGYAHERGVIHRDIKPDNILLDAETARPMVTDFGIARAVSDGDSRLTATGMAIGTPAYMSPEQAAGERTIDGRSDLYSLGILGYQMLVGEPPFAAGSTPAMLVKHISERPVPVEQRRADVPTDLARAVMLLLEKDPANRFPTAAALVAALDGRAVGDWGAGAGERGTGIEARGSGLGNTAARAIPNPEPRYPNAGSSQFPSPDSRVPSPGSSAFPTPDFYVPTPDDIRRWESPPVNAFRRKMAPYIYVNAVILIASAVGRTDFFGITVLWSIYMAFKYAKLWADGYDWRDVFRQPRDRELMDVFDELVARLRGLYDADQRKRLREQRDARRLARRSSAGSALRGFTGTYPGSSVAPASAEPLPDDAAMQAAGPHGARIRQAASDRDEIRRLVDSMPAADRARLPDVVRSASALYDRVKALALSLTDLERNVGPGALDQLEAEVARLEGAANPLDGGSEDRVRRLAYLKRQRRALSELAQRRDAIAGKLETCAIALQNMRLDMVRLRAGGQTYQQVTSLAMSALSLADSVDSALYVADELGSVSARRGSARSTAG